MASLDAQQYAEALRKSLMEDLFNGEELDDDSSDQQQGSLALQGMEDSSHAQQQVGQYCSQRHKLLSRTSNGCVAGGMLAGLACCGP
jgi:hypothetical protein